MRSWNRHIDAMVMSSLLVVLVAACDGDTDTVTTGTPSTLAASASTTMPATTTTSLAITTSAPTTTAGRTPVYGSTTCARTEWSGEVSDGQEIIYEHYSCVDEMSDPRVSGPDEYDVETILSAEGDDLAAPWTAELVVSNEGGSWRGTCTGALDYTSDPNGLPMNYGICTLTGEGGYAGLSYVFLGAGGNEGLVQAGWIEPAE